MRVPMSFTEIEVLGQVLRFGYRVLLTSSTLDAVDISQLLGWTCSPQQLNSQRQLAILPRMSAIFWLRDQFLMKWRAAINFPSFPEQFQKIERRSAIQTSISWAATLVREAFFHSLFFRLTLFILQPSSPRCPIIILLCFIWFSSAEDSQTL